MVAGTELAATPLGNPIAASEIAELKFSPTVASTNEVLPPVIRFALSAFAVSVKVGTIAERLNACVCVIPPPDAFKVTVALEVTAVEATLRVNVLLPLPGDAMLLGTNLAATPFGNPLTEKAMAE